MMVTWQVEDGYGGKARPQETEIDDDELAELDSDEDRDDYINQCIQEDFDENISWYRTDK